MKYLCLIRHGSYFRENLNETGIAQIEKVVESMKRLTGQAKDHYIISSTAPRARQSAEIIAKAFGFEVVEDERLWTSGGDYLDDDELNMIDDIVERHKDYDVITIVSHYEIMKSYPRHFFEGLTGFKTSYGIFEKGRGIYFDVVEKKPRYLP